MYVHVYVMSVCVCTQVHMYEMYFLQPVDLPELFPRYQTSQLRPPEDGSQGQSQGQRFICPRVVLHPV